MSSKKLTSSNRAYLRGLSNALNPIFQLGKEAIGENFIKQVDEALEARELIKISILETYDGSAKDVSAFLSEQTNSQTVQVIGRKFILYREAKKIENRKIKLS